jgi:hypothetical protein
MKYIDKTFFIFLISTLIYSSIYIFVGIIMVDFINNQEYFKMIIILILFLTHFIITILYVYKMNEF